MHLTPSVGDLLASAPEGWSGLHTLGGQLYEEGTWLFGKRAWVADGLANETLRTSGGLATPFEPALTRSAGYRAFAHFWANAMVMQGPERHRALRRSLGGLPDASSGEDHASLEAAVVTEARRIVDQLPGEFDLVEDVGAPLPIAVIARVLGVDFATLAPLREDADALSLFLGGAMGDADRVRVLDAAGRLWSAFERLLAAPLGAGLLARLAADPTLRPAERLAQAILIFAAGHQTTGDALAALATALATSDEARSAPMTRVVEEVLRLDSPVQMAARVASAPLRLGPASILPGERVLLSIGAANRDPDVYEAPGELRLDLHRTPHLAFGAGPHACLGAWLARTELRAAGSALLDRGTPVLLAPPTRLPNATFRRVLALRMRLAPPGSRSSPPAAGDAPGSRWSG